MWSVVKVLIQNLFYKPSFQIFAELISKRNLLENDNALGWKCFLRVSGMCLVLSFWFLPSLWQLASWWVWWLFNLHYQLIHTNLFGVQKMVTLQRFHFKRYYITIIITMTIKKTIFKFYQFQLKYRLFNLFNFVCKDLSTSLRCFCLLKGAE